MTIIETTRAQDEVIERTAEAFGAVNVQQTTVVILTTPTDLQILVDEDGHETAVPEHKRFGHPIDWSYER